MLLMLLITVLSMSPALRLKFLEKLFGKRDAVVPEKLSDENAKKILGDYANHVVMYNFDTHQWNRHYYLGHPVMTSGVTCTRIKAEIERVFPHLQVVAVVGIAAQQRQIKIYNVFPKPASADYPNPLAYATFITRDKKTGKLNELPQKWIQLSECAHPSFVCEAMPQLLSGIGWSSAPMWMVEWCLDGAKVTDPLIDDAVLAQQLKKHKKILSSVKQK